MATPISQIKRSVNPSDTMASVSSYQNDDQLLNDIIQEVSAGNTTAYNYATDQVNVPPAANQQVPSSGAASSVLIAPPHGDKLLYRYVDIGSHPGMANFANYVVIFAILVCISLAQFNRALFAMLPGLLYESGQVSFQGIVLKSVIGVIVYGMISSFII
jgi:hypothetical protein